MTQRETKQCQNCRNEFTIESDDFDFYKKIDVPPPTFCPDCREQRRLAFRNERALYKRICDLCNKEVVSRVSPDKPYPMYCKKCYYSDNWNPLDYGRDYDFSKPFFAQFRELMFEVPHVSLLSSNMIDSEYVNQETDDKNCYLNVGGHYNEDSAYNTYELYGKDCFDNYWVFNSELCYESINCGRCYQTLFSENCYDCRDTILSYDCRNCSNIFGCAGLRNKQYCIFNEQHSKEEYEKFIKENPITLHKSLNELKERAQKVWLSIPHRYAIITKCVNSTGNYIHESKNARNCWAAEKVEDGKYHFIAGWAKDCYDMTSFGYGELLYEGAHSVGLHDSKFFMHTLGGGRGAASISSSRIEYCYAVTTSSDCFGCTGLRSKQYCILNKQYSKQEYEELMSKIRKHMNEMPYTDKKGRVYSYGEFFPVEFSPFGYNETAAMDYFPFTREQASKEGYSWSDYESETSYEFSDYEIPDNIQDVKDSILDKVLKCEASEKAYKLIPMELQFYRRMGIPVPRRSPLQRHKDRIAKLLPRKLHDRKCQCVGEQSDNKVYANTSKNHQSHKPDEHCPNDIKTPYALGRKEIVYCKQCYQAEIA